MTGSWAWWVRVGSLRWCSWLRGWTHLQQALYTIRDGDEEELADGLADYR